MKRSEVISRGREIDSTGVPRARDEEVDPRGSTVPVREMWNQCGVADQWAALTVYPDPDHDSLNVPYGVGAPVGIDSWLLEHTSPWGRLPAGSMEDRRRRRHRKGLWARGP